MAASSSRTAPLTGSPPASQQVAVGPAFYRGMVIGETAGAAAKVRVHDGTSTAGAVVDEVALVANASAAPFSAEVFCPGGIYVEVVSGTVEGAVRVG